MPRPFLLPAATILAALTALALILTALAIRPPTPVALADPTEAANRAAVERFYEAVNATIATGDPGSLDAILTANYTERAGDDEAVPGRERLVRYLQVLHDLAPELRLDARDVVGDGDRLVVQVQVRVDGVTFLGLPVAADTPFWGSVDDFRVADGRIAERASEGDVRIRLERLTETFIDLVPPDHRVLSTVRVALPAGASQHALVGDGIRLLYVETGALAITVTWPSDWEPGRGEQADWVSTEEELALAASEHLELPVGASYVVRNFGPEPAVLLESGVTVAPPTYAMRTPVLAESSEPVTVQGWVGGQASLVTTGPNILSLGRATLAPGARFAWDEAPGPVLLFVETGTLVVASDGGGLSIWREAEGPASLLEREILEDGDGAVIEMGTPVQVQNVGDAELVVQVVTLCRTGLEPGSLN